MLTDLATEEVWMRARFLVSLIATGLVVGLLLTGCGESGQQNDQSQDSEAQQPKQGRTGEQEPLSGTVVRVLPENEVIVVRSVFKYRPDQVRVTLDGKEVEPDAIAEGQKAEVLYSKVTTEQGRDINVVRSIKLQSENDAPGGDTTG